MAKVIFKEFEGAEVRVITSSNGVFYSAHDIAKALKFENPRKEVIALNMIRNNDDVALVEIKGKEVFVTSRDFIIELSLNAEKLIAAKFINWILELEVSINRGQGNNELTENSQYRTNKFATTQIAQAFGISAVTLNKILHDEGIQYKVNKKWVLYGKYVNQGLVVSLQEKNKNWIHSYWTPKGFDFIEAILKNRGYERIIGKKKDENNSQRNFQTTIDEYI